MSFSPLRFLEAAGDRTDAKAGIVGIPFDGTTSYRPGTRFGPDALRRASDSIETYDPNLDRDLEDHIYIDFGNVFLETSDPGEMVERVRNSLNELPEDLPLIMFGGEHSVTLPPFERALKQYPDLAHIVFDAHADLRKEYEGSPHSHASITHRVVDLIGPERVAMFGIRSGLRDEFSFMREHNMLHVMTPDGLSEAMNKLGNRPLYISVDLDGFDPSEVPGTGTVEPGGFRWLDFEPMVKLLLGKQVVGADVVELAPSIDPTGRSDVYAARVARALLLLLLENR
ncbi:agmatinase [bacterium]|nr:agmatinase [bacterium]